MVPDPGFVPFSVSAGTLSDQMNSWGSLTGAGVGWTAGSGQTLVDFIDDTAFNAAPYAPPVLIQDNTVAANGSNTSTATATGCNGDNGVGTNSSTAQRVPAQFTVSANPATRLTSFYACVNSAGSVARIYIRGNALVRLNDNRAIKFPTANNTPFLPTANVRVYARGVIVPS